MTRSVDTAKTPEDVFDALREYDAGTKSWEEVKEIATGVKYGKPEPSPWGDIILDYVTFNDAVSMARIKKVITAEQIAELKALGKFDATERE